MREALDPFDWGHLSRSKLISNQLPREKIENPTRIIGVHLR